MVSVPPKVLISYSYDSPEHQQRVLELADRLRADGIDCTIDQYVVTPAQGWPRWMDKQIRDSDFVVMVCTETYYQRVMGRGRFTKLFYRAESMNTTFIPVLFELGDNAHIPAPLQSKNYYSLDTGSG
jgi:TIR domain